MTKVLFISTECYPAAKAGGMGDVVGALPLYLPQHGIEAAVILPKYDNGWFKKQQFELVHSGSFQMGIESISFKLEKLKTKEIEFQFYCIDIPGKFDREDIYLAADGHGYKDETQRNLSFQLAVLHCLQLKKLNYNILHCHDHMTGLISFFTKHGKDFPLLRNVKTIFTIHNGQYRGVWNWDMKKYFPEYDEYFWGLLDWDGHINCLATAIKCSDSINTVSPTYMDEISKSSDTLNPLYSSEKNKCVGILNGIDDRQWDPHNDKYLNIHLEKNQWSTFKKKNKGFLENNLNLKPGLAMISYIGRLADQKGADLLAHAIDRSLGEAYEFNAVILGTGDKTIEEKLVALANKYPKNLGVIIAYDEQMARTIYAASDFLIMPSRFEPCGLNQMYAMRYGTIPVVNEVGGLKDTVPDISKNGNGISFPKANEDYVYGAIRRSLDLYNDKQRFNRLRRKIVNLDFSWHNSAKEYAQLYENIK